MSDLENTPIETDPVSLLRDLRERTLAGEELKPEEYRDVLASLRRNRTATPAASSRKKVSAPTTEQKAAFNELDNLFNLD
jgi:hypothetical protein